MGSELIIIPIIFGAIFGVFYLYFSTRNKERLALIEKGADASIFMKGKGHTARKKTFKQTFNQDKMSARIYYKFKLNCM